MQNRFHPLIRRVILGTAIACLAMSGFAQAVQAPLGRSNFSFGWNANAVLGTTDRYDVYFDVPVSNIKNGLYGGSFEITGISQNRMGMTLRGGYQRLFYTSIGLVQSAKNFYASDVLFSYAFAKTVKRWDPYFTVGPGIIYSKSGVQAFAKAGFGTRYFLGRHWSLNFAPLAVTDFSGIRGEAVVGLNLHIYPKFAE